MYVIKSKWVNFLKCLCTLFFNHVPLKNGIGFALEKGVGRNNDSFNL